MVMQCKFHLPPWTVKLEMTFHTEFHLIPMLWRHQINLLLAASTAKFEVTEFHGGVCVCAYNIHYLKENK